MGEARQKSRSKADILRGEARCIYCDDAPTTVEHMPPRSMFLNSLRLSGHEYASCADCNHATRGADAAASLLARVAPEHSTPKPILREMDKLMSTLKQIAPEFLPELVRSRERTDWVKGRNQVYGRLHRLNLDGPITTDLMHVFGTKLGMALYRELVGKALPLDGHVFCQHYFNSGLYRDEVEAILSILPNLGQLTQGKKTSGTAFNYRFNTDGKDIVAAFCAFHGNLFFRVFAISDQKYFSMLSGYHDLPPLKIGQLAQIASRWAPALAKSEWGK